MDNYRLILILSLGIVLFFIYQAWIEDYGAPAQPSPTETIEEVGTVSVPEGVPESAAPVARPMAPSTLAAGGSSERIFVETDTLRLEIALEGGALVNAWLKDYAATADEPDDPFQLLKASPPNMFIAQSGLLGAAGTELPTHKAVFAAAKDRYELGDAEELTVELYWEGGDGIQVIKRYHFKRGSYEISASQEVVNQGDAPIAMRAYSQLQRTEYAAKGQSQFIHTYTGGVYYTPEDKYKKVSFSNMEDKKLDKDAADGWIAMIQHYFMAAWIPPTDRLYTFYTNSLGEGRYIIGMYSPAMTVAPGSSGEIRERLFVGPKLNETLRSIAPGLELAVDYGWLTVLAQPIFWVLNKIHSLIGNWGWSIVILTILIKLAFFKLSETSYRSMAGMRKITPRIKALKDRYGDDKAKLNQAMMDLYKKEKVNPLNGCLPILVQIPVFIALYWVLLESVELRHASFIFWLNNLSEPDPFYVLPLIMGASMFLQTKLNPEPPDPIQAKVMMSLPFVFTVFFAFFPAGLVLYWTVNNILSIAQQWYITRDMEKKEAKK